MEYRKLGTSDLEVSAICFGTWAAGGWMWGGTERKDAVKAIRAAYDCGVTYIDTYQIHWPDTTTPIEETMKTVAQLIKDGKVRHAGVCNYNREQLEKAQKYVTVVSDQVPYSMVKRKIEEDVVPYCIENHL